MVTLYLFPESLGLRAEGEDVLAPLLLLPTLLQLLELGPPVLGFLIICFGIYSVARWQNLIPSFPWTAPGWRADKRDQILQRNIAGQ